MDEPWLPNALNVGKVFKEAHDGKLPQQGQEKPTEIVTKKEIEKLEAERRPAPPIMALTPPGVRPCRSAEERHEARIAAMKERMRKDQGKARDDFERSGGR